MNRSLELYERRAAAYLTDFMIAVLVSVIINILLGAYLEFSFPAIFNLFFTLPFICYAGLVWFQTFIFNGKTIGGMIFRLRIVSADYHIRKRRLSFFSCFIRAMCLAVYTIVFASFFYMLVKKTTVAYFDAVAHTVVIAD